MAIDFSKRPKGTSKREYAAMKLGGKPSDYDDNGKKKSSSSKSSSKSSSNDFEKMMKDKGAWDYYQTLSPDQQEFAKYNWNITKSDAKEDIKLYQEALDEATKQAEPYWKSYLLVAQDEVQRAVDEVQKTTQSEVEKNQRVLDSLKENLASNKEFLSLEQQSDLVNLTKNYEVQTEQVVGGAAEAGLTFSTKRKLAEQRLAESQTGLVESTQRKYNKQIRDLTTEAEKGSTEAQKQIEDLKRRMGETITGIGRQAEAKLGTKNIPAISGYAPLGDVSGELYEQKTKDISDRQQALFAEKSRESLTF